jgi:hypothetical protein
MNKRHASSSFSTPQPKRQDLPLIITPVEDYDDLFTGPLTPLTPLDDSLDDSSSDEEVPPSSKWCRRAEDRWMLLGEVEDDLSGISWKSM